MRAESPVHTAYVVFLFSTQNTLGSVDSVRSDICLCILDIGDGNMRFVTGADLLSTHRCLDSLEVVSAQIECKIFTTVGSDPHLWTLRR